MQTPAKPILRLLVGLGNPGPKYQHTRHNAGFWWADALAARCRGVWREESRFRGEVARARIDGVSEDVWLLKPLTFMNLSGESIAAFARFHRIDPAQILLAHDELDLPAGAARLKFAGGHGGHNGLRNTIAQLGPEFWRLRLGIGHPGHKDQVLDYVLNRASKDDEALIEAAVAESVQALSIFLIEGADKAMQRLHGRRGPPFSPSAADESRGH